ncbi:hypothetical protein [Klebsiella quasipneumoniae]|uniref:hypothetical protein n=1 Tax=Klebsiella quasipneumoniae TaxID=1463165 RepID=UPI00197B1208|nr:hypothetical protein [Klebsiella quasipneumoniae]
MLDLLQRGGLTLLQNRILGCAFFFINASFFAVAAVKATCNSFILLFNAACSFAGFVE